MIYVTPDTDWPLDQGDLFRECPILFWKQSDEQNGPLEPETADVQALVLTQACDLAQTKSTRVLVAVVHDARELVDRGTLKGNTIRDHIRAHRVFGWYFLPATQGREESIVDLRDLHTIPRSLLNQLIQAGKRTGRIQSPYREHLAQHFATTYSRIGLPLPYETTAE